MNGPLDNDGLEDVIAAACLLELWYAERFGVGIPEHFRGEVMAAFARGQMVWVVELSPTRRLVGAGHEKSLPLG